MVKFWYNVLVCEKSICASRIGCAANLMSFQYLLGGFIECMAR
jgi:hypothetical protein